MFNTHFENTLYVQIRENSFRLRHIESKKDFELSAQRPFTTARLLVGQYQTAELLLRKGIKEIGNGGLFRISPVVVMHPLEMVEGGLSEVEERLYQELALSSGARIAFVYLGLPLTDREVVSISQRKTK